MARILKLKCEYNKLYEVASILVEDTTSLAELELVLLQHCKDLRIFLAKYLKDEIPEDKVQNETI